MVTGYCYDADIVGSVDCLHFPRHAEHVHLLGLIGVVPEVGSLHPCSCEVSMAEQKLVRDFKEGLGSGNEWFIQELRYRLEIFLFSERYPAAFSVFAPGRGLLMYYNSLYSKKTMSGCVTGGKLIVPSTADEVEPFVPRYSPGLVFPLVFGAPVMQTTVGSLMGSTRTLRRFKRFVRDIAFTGRSSKGCLCDVSVYVVTCAMPTLGMVFSCGCRVLQSHIDAIRKFMEERTKAIFRGTEIDMQLRALLSRGKHLSAFINYSRSLGATVLLGPEAVTSGVDFRFVGDGIVFSSRQEDSPGGVPLPSRSFNKSFRDGLASAVPMVRYMQYH